MEEVDGAGEVWDYDESEASTLAWINSGDLGPLLVNHVSWLRAGELLAATLCPLTRTLFVTARLSVRRLGAYTGFSMGGSYARRWSVGKHTYYASQIRHVSLVDNPCLPSAIVKAGPHPLHRNHIRKQSNG